MVDFFVEVGDLEFGLDVDLVFDVGADVVLFGLAVLLIRTKQDRKIASSETIIVSSPNGNGSNCETPGGNVLIAIQTMNQSR